MKRLLPLLTLAGLGILAAVFARLDVSTLAWRPALNRAQALDAARRLAATQALDLTGWRLSATTREDKELRDAVRANLPAASLRLFTALTLEVSARRPDGSAQVLFSFSSDGRPLSFEQRLMRRPPPGDDPNHDQLASGALRAFAGAAASNFRRTAIGFRTRDGLHSAWEWADPQSPGVTARFEATTRNGQLQSARLSHSVASRLTEPVREGGTAVGAFKVGMIIASALGGVLGAIVLIFLAWTRRSDHVRFALRFTLAAVPLYVLYYLGTLGQETGARIRVGDGPVDPTSLLNTLIAAFALLFVLFCLAAAGFARLPELERRHWVGLFLLTRGRLWTQPVATAHLWALLAGPALAAVPYLAALLTSATPVALLDPAFLFSSFPWLPAFRAPLTGWDTLAPFLFLLPLIWSWLERPALRWGLLAGVSILFSIAQADPFAHTFWPNLVAGTLSFAVVALLYQTQGLLTVFLAPLSVTATWQAATLFAAGPAFRGQAWSLTVFFVALAGLAALAARFAPEVDTTDVEAAMEPGEDALSRSERDRLQAEFAVARKAQQNLLPNEPPALDGYTLSALCEPAREVGGDLYDFFPLTDGRQALVVADVSGKGVPAALYMTLTRGLLAAARHHSADLVTLASRLNRFLGETGKRRTFVTMSFVALAPEKASFRHFRAGHNPPLVYRAATRTSEFLLPKGIGLGITGPAAFDRNLEIEELSLEPGDVLVLYSDGLTECMNIHQDQFGEERLRECVHTHAHLDARGIEAAVVEAVRAFRGKADPHDDLTLVVLRANPLP